MNSLIRTLPLLLVCGSLVLAGCASAPQQKQVKTIFIKPEEGTAGVRAAFVGGNVEAAVLWDSDLSLALGCTPTFDDLDPRAAEAVEHILARAKAHGVVAGIHNGTPEAALRRIARGFQFVTVSSDARLMAAGSQQVLAKMRAGPAKSGSGSY